MGKVMESHGISKAQKNMNPAGGGGGGEGGTLQNI